MEEKNEEKEKVKNSSQKKRKEEDKNGKILAALYLPGRSCARAAFMLEVPVLETILSSNIVNALLKIFLENMS